MRTKSVITLLKIRDIILSPELCSRTLVNDDPLEVIGRRGTNFRGESVVKLVGEKFVDAINIMSEAI